MGILCVSVDLDEIRCYHEIHGLPPEEAPANIVYGRALDRIGEFMQRLGIQATLFAVGRDLSQSVVAGPVLKDFVTRGHEVANHTMNHRYDLTLLTSDEQVAEIREGAATIKGLVGVRPPGFRAPGYNVHLGLLDHVEDEGHSYDSSVFPCATYMLAKTAAMSWKTLRGNPSRSIMGDPRVLLSPNRPYRLGRDGVWSTGNGMCELPITVVTPARLPFIGTSITLMGRRASRILARTAARMAFVNLELHGIDFIDGQRDGLGYLTRYQPDLKISLDDKLDALEGVVQLLLDRGMQAMTLHEASKRVFV